jgi:nitric oxide synthase oxygenase domain/subunit
VLLRASHVSSLFIVVEIKVDVRLLAQTYHREREESREHGTEDRTQKIENRGQKTEVRSQNKEVGRIFWVRLVVSRSGASKFDCRLAPISVF